MNKFYTAQEVADRLKIKKATVYELIKRGELNSSKVGKQLRISEEQLEQYLDHQSAPDPETENKVPEFQPESSILKRDYLLHSSGLILSGQTTPALELLLSQMSVHPDGVPVLQTHMNTYNSLYSLYFNKVHMATAGMEASHIAQLMPGTPITLIQLYKYLIGFYIRKGNPLQISDFSDLCRSNVTFVNREKGSTQRIFLDNHLKEENLSSDNIIGYKHELVSDLTAASEVSRGNADVSIGEQAIVRRYPGLDFVPLGTIPMYLVMNTASVEKPEFASVLDIVRSEDFRDALLNQTGYDVSHTGEVLYL